MELTDNQKSCPYCHYSENIVAVADNWNSEFATKMVVLKHSAANNEDTFLKFHLIMVKRLGYLWNLIFARCVVGL
ncbi:hypothetical protein [Limosilactobacillus oris]|uniref:hypothetical protein n=1 Tax=Limosilactobacillus oris TaxID=1632 RepID=UPI002235A28D|nr:hypothetical protein [Limosilactobacillus oris]MCW4387833.1 hypothetical protein [Limosilactobacillus oris]